jgi:hypothetical protein
MTIVVGSGALATAAAFGAAAGFAATVGFAAAGFGAAAGFAATASFTGPASFAVLLASSPAFCEQPTTVNAIAAVKASQTFLCT